MLHTISCISVGPLCLCAPHLELSAILYQTRRLHTCGGHDPTHRSLICFNNMCFKPCVFAATTVLPTIMQLSARYLSEQRRYYYVTPTSYLELLLSYKGLLGKRQSEVCGSWWGWLIELGQTYADLRLTAQISSITPISSVFLMKLDMQHEHNTGVVLVLSFEGRFVCLPASVWLLPHARLQQKASHSAVLLPGVSLDIL